NPFSTELLKYEIWHNEQLLDTVHENHYTLSLADHENHIGCVTIRAVRGTQKSAHSPPVCYVVQI
ncbi:MAG: hypothetical protein AAF404_16175, partial [Pseudomonadota bacterium]